MKIYFATKNANKVKEVKEILKDVEVEQINLDIEEIQNEDVEVVVKDKAEKAAKLTGKTVIVEDTGLYIEALNGFPGALIVFIENSIGNKGILKLMEGVDNRRVTAKAAIGYCDGSETMVFVGEVKGTIAEEEHGTEGFGFDPIFIPDGFTQTYAEMGLANKNKISHRKKTLEKFREYISCL